MKLDTSRLGMKAFNITFPALLGPMLSTTLRNSVNVKNFFPKDPREIALHEHIFDALIVTMLHLPQIMVDMESECGRFGPKAFTLGVDVHFVPDHSTFQNDILQTFCKFS